MLSSRDACTDIHFFQTLAATCMDDQELTESMQKLLIVMQRLDEKIGPMLEADGELFNKRYINHYVNSYSCSEFAKSFKSGCSDQLSHIFLT